MAKRNVPIRYTSRDFNSIRQDLLNYAKRYYPDTFKDFSEASFGSLMIDTVAYVGDIMSFYLDYQVNESFIDTSVEYDNILRLAKQMGYKYIGSPSSTGIVSFYAIIPANTVGLGPNSSYMPILKRGSTLASSNGASFILTEDIRFDNPNNSVVAAQIASSTGLPTSYAVKAQGQVISGRYKVETVSVGTFERFKTVRLPGRNIAEILSVFDSSGNEYYEVEYLTHDVVYKSVPNKDSNTRDNAPSLIRPFVAARRFRTEKDRTGVSLQFGYGSESEIASPTLADPANVVLQRHARDHITDTAFDPSNLIGTDKLGIGPANTTLTITYRENTASNVNASVGAVNRVVSAITEFNDSTLSNTTTARSVITSIECSNEEPIVGSVSTPSIEEIRNQALNIFPSQNRAVTSTDYEAITYMMPSYYGAVKRCRVIRDQDSLKRNLNMYVTSEDSLGFLIGSNSALKENLKTWLNKYRMINDTVDILDAKIVNIGIEFEVVSSEEVNKYEVLDSAIMALREKFSNKMFIGERFYVTDVYTELNKVRGVVDTVDVKLVSKRAGRYSDSSININQFMSVDGRYLSVPDNVILEIKYPKIDIKGTVK
tara:strand:+ start:10461 stop:12257 length:1797 start_codon:yes stop_codon:yes gene_type:complete